MEHPPYIPSELLERQRRTRGYGWLPDLPDARDQVFNPVSVRVPPRVDLRETGFLPPVWDQGDIGSCTGHGVGALVAYRLAAEHGRVFQPSRLFIYYNERVLEGSVAEDAGAYIRDGIKAVAKVGVCDETLWPYETGQYATAPPQEAYENALNFQALAYKRVPRRGFKASLAAGLPVVFGFTVFESFESDAVGKSGDMPMPTPGEHQAGGHCVLLVGYNDSTETWLCRNSWGIEWGQGGYFTMPYAFLSNPGYSSDFWTITDIEG